MAWITPFKNWIASRVPLPSDFNRIEGNIDYLKERGDADRTLTLTGDVSGATTYDDNSGISVITTVADNSHNHVTDNITDATSNNSANKIVKRDSAGNFVANIITATLNGLAAAATKLATARTISISGHASGSTSFDGSGNADISLTVAHAAQAAKLQTARTISISGNANGSTSFDGSGNADLPLTINYANLSETANSAKDSLKLGGFEPGAFRFANRALFSTRGIKTTNITRGALHSELSVRLNHSSTTYIITGSIVSGGDVYILSSAFVVSSTEIDMYGMNASTGKLATLYAYQNDTFVYSAVNIAL